MVTTEKIAALETVVQSAVYAHKRDGTPFDVPAARQWVRRVKDLYRQDRREDMVWDRREYWDTLVTCLEELTRRCPELRRERRSLASLFGVRWPGWWHS